MLERIFRKVFFLVGWFEKYVGRGEKSEYIRNEGLWGLVRV